VAVVVFFLWVAALTPAELFPVVGATDGDLALQEEAESELAHFVSGADSEPGPRWSGKLLVRLGTDSVTTNVRRLAGFSRLDIKQGRWQATGAIEKDAGETRLADGTALGLQYCRGSLKAVIGDYVLGLGQGLVFSTSASRSLSHLVEAGTPGPILRLANRVEEVRRLCGLGIEHRSGRWQFAGAVSCAGRDAKLNPDGTVLRLTESGVHDDSTARAEENQVQEFLAGAGVHYRSARVVLAGCGQFIRFNRAFAPRDSASSFAGRELAGWSLGIGWVSDAYQLDAEWAIASTGGQAAALRVTGEWPGLVARMAVRGYQRTFFAPHGRVTGLTGRKDRLDATASFSYQVAGLELGANGNTFRDFEVDSLPARVEMKVGQRFGRARVELVLGRSFKLAMERYRTGRLALSLDMNKGWRGDIILADEYPEQKSGRGRMVGMMLRAGEGPLQAGLAAALFDISGSGIRMSVYEPGAMRIGSSFSTSQSAWRLAAGVGLVFAQGSRVGVKFGCTWKERPVLETAGQVELGLGG